ncbi:2OG-Fe(II) oxygenase [Kaistia terrae]|uniref:2OG-Fe(II) oxygenase n=1 Tax=Kaistia terrae TaxID=537017 RepID=A0ABW0PUD3_9HYPH|nr:2OG-Fe(II) oxygenase [Kaistia terrae]MCX5577039.1 2OG-Fe(II) oxygenase [Kaistia terrae]
MDLNFHVVTVATDVSRAGILIESSRKFEVPVLNLGSNVPWRAGQAGGLKINLLKRFLSGLDDANIVLFVDGYDTLVNAPLDEIAERFFEAEVDILFAAQRQWRSEKDLSGHFPETKSGDRYLNGGAYVGLAASLREFLSAPLADDDDDQTYLSEAYLRHSQGGSDIQVALDTEARLFQSVSAASSDITITEEKQILNTTVDRRPLILHGGGDKADKRRFTNLGASLGISRKQIQFTGTNGAFDVVGPEIILTDFLDPAECRKLIAMAEDYGEWKSMYGDKFPAQELRLRTLDINLFNKLEVHFANDLNKIIEKYWWPMRMICLRDAFIIKYSPDTQASLSCHTDASMVSGIVKLNDDYEGGDTWFHRQQYSTKYAPVGKMVLWPGQVTHGHEGREVTAGTKYSLVIWTSRTRNDLNY